MSSRLDHAYARLSRRHRFFADGWGAPERLEAFRGIFDAIPAPRTIAPRWEREQLTRRAWVRDGRFASPLALGGLPPESSDARFRLIVPRSVRASGAAGVPVCVHMASTGDEGYARRWRLLGRPLLRAGIGSLLLEQPYYGARRPQQQVGVYLRSFSDLLTMGHACAEEGRALLTWLRAEGFGPLAITGISMGAQMASLAAATVPFGVATVPCIGGHSAEPVFLEGLLSQSVAWDVLSAPFDGDMTATRAYAAELLGCADIRHIAPPKRLDAAVLVGARRDAYVPPWSLELQHAHWAGAEVRWVDTGHVGAFVHHAATFRRAIEDALGVLTRPR